MQLILNSGKIHGFLEKLCCLVDIYIERWIYAWCRIYFETIFTKFLVNFTNGIELMQNFEAERLKLSFLVFLFQKLFLTVYRPEHFILCDLKWTEQL